MTGPISLAVPVGRPSLVLVQPGGPFPGNLSADFIHVLQHVIGLLTVIQRERIMLNVKVVTVDYLVFIDKESLLIVLPVNIIISGISEK